MARWPAPLIASAFNRLGQCAISPDNQVYCYAEVAVSSVAVTHGGMARLSMPEWLVKYHKQSPILVLTLLDVEQLCRWVQRRYHEAELPSNSTCLMTLGKLLTHVQG